ncbi:hypothetical protein C8Q80DRAFT_1275525 [Daedaleopsis nitida]|nr:hypothetical protein C8Q80DRAFT_1275525 [Daedaleopsis nitida]
MAYYGRLIDSDTWQTVKVIKTDHDIVAGSLSPNRAFLAASVLSLGFVIYDLETEKVIRHFEQELGDEERAIHVLFIHGGHAIVGGSTAGCVSVWFVESEYKLVSLQIPNGDKVLALAAHYDSVNDRFIIATGAMNDDNPSTTSIWTVTVPSVDDEVLEPDNVAETTDNVAETAEDVVETMGNATPHGHYMVGCISYYMTHPLPMNLGIYD